MNNLYSFEEFIINKLNLKILKSNTQVQTEQDSYHKKVYTKTFTSCLSINEDDIFHITNNRI